ncbi:cell division cycle protein 20 homolog [Pecten maximus]|uniref:cell division cycle protein 20 homolog n=1 Tax=Pecten maximus TaxID=6579 RepID=UPI001458A065|nr:cell division cycle protein 20 homolog [Pecten maximus]
MSQFQFHSMVSEVTRMDGEIKKGPKMRWQRKAEESGLTYLQVGAEPRGPLSPWKPRSAKTPSGITPKTPLSPSKTLTFPSSNKTPGKTQPQGKHPSKTPNKTPGKQPQPKQDRFIPNRATTDIDMSHYAMMNDKNDENTPPPKTGYHQQLNEALSKGQNPQNAKVLSFKDKAPEASAGHLNNLKVLYSSSKSAVPKCSTTRFIPQQPDRILDAPELLDDYYLNLLDWSSNHLAVALGGAVYLWNASDGSIVQLMEMTSTDDYVSCVSWIKEGNILAVGTNMGNTQLWDAEKQKLVRTMPGHSSRVGSLAWNTFILSSGARSGIVRHHDVRVADHHVGTMSNHTQEVCGLSWSHDGRYLASGGNDNLLNIWDNNMSHESVPVHTFTHHQAAVKALSWCPWQADLLASGGGTADRHIRFWNVSTGSCYNSVDTNSQVCSILWSKEHKELISGHGYSQNQLTIWKYPTMTRVAELTGHTARVLCLTMSPDGTTVASAAADETIRLWKCFDAKPTAANTKSNKDTSSFGQMRAGIR